MSNIALDYSGEEFLSEDIHRGLNVPFPLPNPNIRFRPPRLREVTLKVNQVAGINLGQGVCMLPTPREVLEAKVAAIKAGKNMYAPAAGIEPLREALAKKLNTQNHIPSTPGNILVTDGATGSFEVVCRSFLQPGDGVIVFAPYYPYHVSCLELTHADIHLVPLKGENWDFDDDDLAAAYNPRTKFILLNTPANPTGKVFSREELCRIAKFCLRHGILCVTDETYEKMVYDGREHVSPASLPGMSEATISIFSFSKEYAITGWRVGYMVCPSRYVEPLRAMADKRAICAPTPAQYGVLGGLQALGIDYDRWLFNEYRRKREILAQGLEAAGFPVAKPQGAYYFLASTAELFPNVPSEKVSDILIDRIQVGAVPAIDFLGMDIEGDPRRSNFLRFCFSLPDETLHEAARRLATL